MVREFDLDCSHESLCLTERPVVQSERLMLSSLYWVIGVD